jgi:dihydropteroate synthase
MTVDASADPPDDAQRALERALADDGETVRIYVQPLGLVAGRAAAAMAAAGQAQLLAGGPLAFTFCELLRRRGGDIQRHIASVAALEHLIAQRPTPAAACAGILSRRIAAARPDTADRPLLMGVVNVTPDSFSDGGAHLDPAAALAHCRALAAAGAGILDIGGESTRPGAAPVAPATELARVRPVLEGLRDMRADLPGVAISIDTRRAEIMRAALALGVDVINDVTALTGDTDSLAVAAASRARVVLMHMQGTPETMNLAPEYDDVALDVFDYLELRIEACIAAGIERGRLIVDPGIGFGKRGRENREILRALALFHGLGCPILLGLSRKGLGIAKDMPPRDRESISLAAAMHALSQGVQMLRVHDVAATRQAVELWRRLMEEA